MEKKQYVCKNLEIRNKTDSPLSKLAGANSQNKTSELIYQPTAASENTSLLQSACPQLSVQGYKLRSECLYNKLLF